MTKLEIPVIENFYSRNSFDFQQLRDIDLNIVRDLYRHCIDVSFRAQEPLIIGEAQMLVLANYLH